MRVGSTVSTGVCVAAVGLAALSCREASAPLVEQPAAPLTVAMRALAVGDVAPDFSLPASDGKTYTLASYRGRQSVVLAWFAKAFTEG
jgi:cytochrome oxidase Cu insertion factor (SCO1/SenC/PrrC family)